MLQQGGPAVRNQVSAPTVDVVVREGGAERAAVKGADKDLGSYSAVEQFMKLRIPDRRAHRWETSCWLVRQLACQ